MAATIDMAWSMWHVINALPSVRLHSVERCRGNEGVHLVKAVEGQERNFDDSLPAGETRTL